VSVIHIQNIVVGFIKLQLYWPGWCH